MYTNIHDEQLNIGNQENMPYKIEFPSDTGVILYPARGILIMKFPDNIEIMVKQDGCK